MTRRRFLLGSVWGVLAWQVLCARPRAAQSGGQRLVIRPAILQWQGGADAVPLA